MRLLAWPLACYLVMTVIVPLVDGAPVDGEHVATVVGAVAAILVVAHLTRAKRRDGRGFLR